GVGEMVRAAGACQPTILIVAPLFRVTVAELPFVASPPPLAAVHDESTIIEPSRMIGGPPEIGPAGQPFRPFARLELPLSRRRTEYGGGWTGPLTAWLVVFTSNPL